MLNVLAGSDDATGWFVTEHVWRIGAVAEPVPIALPAMPVRATDATADDLGDGAVGVGFRSVDVLDRQRFLGSSQRSTACITLTYAKCYLINIMALFLCPTMLYEICIILDRR